MINIGPRDALIIVDLQNDFTPGGALPVAGGDRIVPVLNRYQALFLAAGAAVYFTRDWHPPDHCSFKDQGGPWPVHCVRDTRGAEFHPGLDVPESAVIISTAQDPDSDAYSGFEKTGLGADLKKRGVMRVFVGGLATDYCVKATVLDALERGFETFLLEDAVRGVEVWPGDSRKALKAMERAGARRLSIGGLA
jgi:nicotinamidase/pyrazinamidase